MAVGVGVRVLIFISAISAGFAFKMLPKIKSSSSREIQDGAKGVMVHSLESMPCTASDQTRIPCRECRNVHNLPCAAEDTDCHWALDRECLSGMFSGAGSGLGPYLPVPCDGEPPRNEEDCNCLHGFWNCFTPGAGSGLGPYLPVPCDEEPPRNEEDCNCLYGFWNCFTTSGGLCNAEEDPPNKCTICLNKNGEDCSEGDQLCVWTIDLSCADIGKGGRSCKPGATLPTGCFVCLNEEGTTCSIGEDSCTWGLDSSCFDRNQDGQPCSAWYPVPYDCLLCVNTSGENCSYADISCSYERDQSCVESESEESDDSKEERSCRRSDTPPNDCMMCLNNDEKKCSENDVYCSWTQDKNCSPGKGNPCPGNRPYTPCEDIDPCEEVGECQSGQDLTCQVSECSSCQAVFYRENGKEAECKEFLNKTCEVPGRQPLVVGKSRDNPLDPCNQCVCKRNGQLMCSTKNNCGNMRRLTLSFETDDCTAIIDDPLRSQEFIDQIRQAIEEATDVPANQIKDPHLVCGSIVVDFTVVEKEGQTLDLNLVTEKIKDQIESGALTITINGQEYLPIQDSFREVQPEPAVTSTTVIVVAILITIVILAIIIAGTLCYLKSKRSKGDHEMDVSMNTTKENTYQKPK